MESQKQVINKLRGLCFRQDIAIDSAILLVGVWVSGISLLQFPIAIVARLASTRSGTRSWLSQVLRLLFIIGFVKKTRSAAVKRGVHSRMGSWMDYVRLGGSYLSESVKSKVGEVVNYSQGQVDASNGKGPVVTPG